MRTFRDKTGLHNYTRGAGGKTTDTRIINLDILDDTPGISTIKKKFKFTYECYNAGENFTGELFDGTKLNPIFEITDLGENRNSSAYVTDPDKIKKRIEDLNVLGIKFIKSLY